MYENNEVSFNDINDAYEIDKCSSTSINLIKITDSHI